jgi:hypothetical protein
MKINYEIKIVKMNADKKHKHLKTEKFFIKINNKKLFKILVA